MTATNSMISVLRQPAARLVNDKRVHEWVAQGVVLLFIVGLFAYFAHNAVFNVAREGGKWGFGFLGERAGVDIGFKLIEYTPNSTYARLLLVGIVNTLFVSLVGIVLTTVLGFAIGIGRLSQNWLLARLCGAFVEIVRNVPLLLFVLAWYFAVIAALPQPRNSLSLLDSFFLNNRGVFFPSPREWDALLAVPIALLVGTTIAWAIARWAIRRQKETGSIFPVFTSSLLLVVGLPLIAAIAVGLNVTWDRPVLRGFGIRGGGALPPEFLALLAALVTYTAGFIAEIIRAGILSVAAGQREAAAALGLNRRQILRLVIVPQAMRVIIPPLTSQYVNLLKNSSYAAVIAYPEIVSVFVGSALNNTGRAVEIIAITLGIYLAMNLTVSAAMNWYNARVAISR
jgi:general L-amino acid transport system permease protein